MALKHICSRNLYNVFLCHFLHLEFQVKNCQKLVLWNRAGRTNLAKFFSVAIPAGQRAILLASGQLLTTVSVEP